MSRKKVDITEHFEKVSIKRPSDVIIEQISNLITKGLLKPGQKLPPERVLAQRFEIGRPHVREALHKLELYGIVHTLPQSGTFVEKIKIQTLERLIRNVLEMKELTVEMLMEVREILEVFAAELAARRASPEQLAEIRDIYQQQVTKLETGEDPLDTDILFHIRLADAANNILLRTLIGLMRHDVLRFSQEHHTDEHGRPVTALEEHRLILEALENHSPEEARKTMRHHIEMAREQFYN